MKAQLAVLDREQLRDVTLDDEELMRDIVAALVDDTARHIVLLDRAIRERDAKETMRLAHCSKGACANAGARSSAAMLLEIERRAAMGDFEDCVASLRGLSEEFEKLRAEASAI
jgi:HPt (histidine-containing phosphotransfer) domain-containing protein